MSEVDKLVQEMAGFSVNSIALTTGLSNRAVAKIRDRRTLNPGIETVRRIREALVVLKQVRKEKAARAAQAAAAAKRGGATEPRRAKAVGSRTPVSSGSSASKAGRKAAT